MPEHRISKATLFGWLAHPRPRGGPRKRWRDVIRKDLKQIGVDEEGWYKEAVSSRGGWREAYQQLQTSPGAEARPNPALAMEEVKCDACLRVFRRTDDLKRHKCSSERQKPVCEQLALHSAQSARNGSAVKEAWQSTDASRHHETTVWTSDYCFVPLK